MSEWEVIQQGIVLPHTPVPMCMHGCHGLNINGYRLLLSSMSGKVFGEDSSVARTEYCEEFNHKQNSAQLM